MINLMHIAVGWGKSLGMLDVSPAEQAESVRRMNICASNVCGKAKQSTFLRLLKGSAEEIDAIYCGGCGCPVNEKSLVSEERCPEGKW